MLNETSSWNVWKSNSLYKSIQRSQARVGSDVNVDARNFLILLIKDIGLTKHDKFAQRIRLSFLTVFLVLRTLQQNVHAHHVNNHCLFYSL